MSLRARSSIQGGELFFHLKNNRRFSEEVARIYVGQIALALGHLHSMSIIYRDLKPEVRARGCGGGGRGARGMPLWGGAAEAGGGGARVPAGWRWDWPCQWLYAASSRNVEAWLIAFV